VFDFFFFFLLEFTNLNGTVKLIKLCFQEQKLYPQ
jgi:hypothetical protein